MNNELSYYYALDAYSYSKYTFKNDEKFQKWTTDSLFITNDNMFKQHQTMRDQLQETHTNMTQFMSCSSMFLSIQQIETTCCYYDENNRQVCTCEVDPPLSVDCCEILGIPVDKHCSNGRRLVESESIITELVVTYENGHKSLHAELQDVEDKEDTIINNQATLRDRMATLQDTVNAIAMKLDMDPEPRENDSKSKKSKKAKQVKPPDDSDESDLFTRNLIGVKEAVNVKFDMMESKVESIETKVKSMEGKIESMGGKIESMKSQGNSIEGQVKSIESKVESMEGKVESMEKTMEELKDMLSQLMMRGADIA